MAPRRRPKPASQTSLFDLQERERLLRERCALANDLDRASAAAAAAAEAALPYVEDFNHAHALLVRLHRQRSEGDAVSKPEMLAAYDERTIQSHRSWPFRKREQDALRWQASVARAMRDLDERLLKMGGTDGRADPAA